MHTKRVASLPERRDRSTMRRTIEIVLAPEKECCDMDQIAKRKRKVASFVMCQKS